MAHLPKTHLFISYRRTIDAAFAHELYNFLSKHFDPTQIFMDVHTIKLGENFVDAIERSVSTCDALIVIIGERWGNILEERLPNKEDFVREEITAALSSGVTVIPVLVDNAEMPKESTLPPGLETLNKLHAIRIRNESFAHDAKNLANFLKKEFHLVRGLGISTLIVLIIAMFLLVFLSLFVVTDPNIRMVFVVVGTSIIVSIFYGINELVRRVYWPWRYLLYLLVPLIVAAILSIGSYSIHFIFTPANALAPDLISYGNALPTLGSYASNARVLKAEADDDGFRRFVRMKFQLICPYLEGRCDAGIIFSGFNGINNSAHWQDLVFEVRGAFGGEIIGVSLKDSLQIEPRIYNIDEFISDTGAITTDWQTVRIPLTNFQGIDLSELRLFTFFVDADYSPDQVVEVYIANLHFV